LAVKQKSACGLAENLVRREIQIFFFFVGGFRLNTTPFGLDYPVLMRERDRRIELAEDGEGEEQEEELLCSCCCCVVESELRGSVLMMVATDRTEDASRILCCCCCGGVSLITTPSMLLIRLREAGR